MLLLLLLLSRFSRVRLCAAHRQQHTRLPHPWDSPGKSTGVGCHSLSLAPPGKSSSGSKISQIMKVNPAREKTGSGFKLEDKYLWQCRRMKSQRRNDQKNRKSRSNLSGAEQRGVSDGFSQVLQNSGLS